MGFFFCRSLEHSQFFNVATKEKVLTNLGVFPDFYCFLKMFFQERKPLNIQAPGILDSVARLI